MTARPRKTSLYAYNKLKTGGQDGGSLLSWMRWAVYDFLYQHGPATGREVDAGLAKPGETRTSYHKRLSELRACGVAEEVGEKTCRVSGERAIAWDVTDAAPDPVGHHIMVMPPNDVVRARGRADVMRLLQAERIALTLFLEQLRQAHAVLVEVSPEIALTIGVATARIHESRKRWIAEDKRTPCPLLVDLEVCPDCGEQQAFEDRCPMCGRGA